MQAIRILCSSSPHREAAYERPTGHRRFSPLSRSAIRDSMGSARSAARRIALQRHPIRLAAPAARRRSRAKSRVRMVRDSRDPDIGAAARELVERRRIPGSIPDIEFHIRAGESRFAIPMIPGRYAWIGTARGLAPRSGASPPRRRGHADRLRTAGAAGGAAPRSISARKRPRTGARRCARRGAAQRCRI